MSVVASGAPRMHPAEERAGLMPAGAIAPDLSFAPTLPFALASGGETFVGKGCLARLREEGTPSGDRARRHFATVTGGPDIVVGALPYASGAPAHLYQPADVSRSAGRACFAAAFPPPSLVRPAPAPARWEVAAEPPLDTYRAGVARALARMGEGGGAAGGSKAGGEILRKVVLSRSLCLRADRPIDATALLRALARDACVTTFCVPLPGGPTGGSRALVGATPELLVARTGDRVTSHPLAGSARRMRDAAEDRARGDALLASDKDRREHREVVTAILDQLAPHCVELGTPEGMALTATASMWHLGTRIIGRLRRTELTALDLAALLHPTPAVCGAPRAAAARAIAELEGYDRGFYAGAVGWCDRTGDGAWHVALRCAEVAGHEARLYAGAGIVPGSDPMAEGEETSAKFAALLEALGIDESGQPAPEEVA